MTDRYPETCVRCMGWVWHRSRPCNCKPSVVPHTGPEFLAALGARLRACRESAKLSLQELAGRVGMSKSGLWEIEQGHNEPMARTVAALAEALEVSADYLLLIGEC